MSKPRNIFPPWPSRQTLADMQAQQAMDRQRLMNDYMRARQQGGQLSPLSQGIAASILGRSAPAYLRAGLMFIANNLHTFPDPAFENTMGYRSWYVGDDGFLCSPHQSTVWRDPELRVEYWDEGDAVRGQAGIHATLVPMAWRRMRPVGEAPHHAGRRIGPFTSNDRPCVPGLVERFGKFVLGEKGWRAEWVVIRKLIAPNRYVMAGLKEMYPEVEIIMGETGES